MHVLARNHVWPLTREIAAARTRLDVRNDPADELIVASTVVHHLPLVARDDALLRTSRTSVAIRRWFDVLRPVIAPVVRQAAGPPAITVDMHVHVSRAGDMRTTIEISEAHRARLFDLAARRRQGTDHQTE